MYLKVRVVMNFHQLYLQAVRNGDLKIIPSMHEKVWYNWLENCRLVMCSVTIVKQIIAITNCHAFH